MQYEKLALIFLALILFGAVQAQVVYISPTGSDENDGSSPDVPVQTFNRTFQLITNSAARVIQVQPGIENELTFSAIGNRNLVLTAFDDLESITINGTAPGLTIDLELSGRFLVFSQFELIINNIAFENGRVTSLDQTESGGIIYLQNAIGGGFITATECVFSDSSADHNGGAIYIDTNGDTSSFSSCSFLRNFATYGGAVYSSGTPQFTATTFSNNRAQVGGALGLQATAEVAPSFISCTFSNNVANGTVGQNAGLGGAIALTLQSRLVVLPAVSFSSCNFTNNYASSMGGAIINSGADARFTGAYFANNSASSAGAIYVGLPANDDSTLTSEVDISNSVFQANTATTSGGAFVVDMSGTLNINATIFTSNSDPNQNTGIVLAEGMLLLVSQSSISNLQFSISGGATFKGTTVNVCEFPSLILTQTAQASLQCLNGTATLPKVTMGQDGQNNTVLDVSSTSSTVISQLVWGAGTVTSLVKPITVSVSNFFGTNSAMARSLNNIHLLINSTATFVPQSNVAQFSMSSSYLVIGPNAIAHFQPPNSTATATFSVTGSSNSGLTSTGTIFAGQIDLGDIVLSQTAGNIQLGFPDYNQTSFVTSKFGNSPVITGKLILNFASALPSGKVKIASFTGNAKINPSSLSVMVLSGTNQETVKSSISVEGNSVYIAQGSSGLTGGQIAGIVIGSILLAVILAGFGGYLIWRYRRESSSSYTQI